MSIENLENRSLMAGDCLHNFVLPEDADASGAVSPVDALVVINRVNRSAMQDSANPMMVDVDADDTVTPRDALIILNHLNSQSMGGDVGLRASRIETQQRIERIEKAIATNALPPNMDAEAAFAILNTLRRGGRPELGDIVENGELRWRQTNPMPADASQPGPVGADGTPEGFERERLVRLVDAVSARLSAFNVSSEIITTIADEMRSALESDNPMQLPQVRDRLAELGVDVDSIFPMPTPPERPDLPERPDQPIMITIMVTEPIAQSIIARLKSVEAAPEVIDTIGNEMFDAINAGTPLDLQQVRARLAELGFDWEKLERPPVNTLPVPPERPELPPARPDQPGRPELPPGRPDQPGRPDGPDQPIMITIMVTEPIAQSIIARLKFVEAAPEVIDTIGKEMFDAINAGTPLDLQQVRARLAELGFDWEKLERPPVNTLPAPPERPELPPRRPDQPGRPQLPTRRPELPSGRPASPTGR
jgi:hypothetical protein